MNKRIFSIIMAAVMVCSVICAAVPEKASAASKKPYMTVDTPWYTGTPWEKVGDYYIWVDHKEENGTHFSSLKCAKSLKKGKAKTLRKITSKTKRLDWNVVTDGNTIYYSIGDWKKGTIYKTAVKGSKHKKVKTVKYLDSVTAFYGGKIYYNVHEDSDDPPIHLYSYDIAKKKTRLEKKDYEVDSAYGRYMIGGQPSYGGDNVTLKLYDAKTGKSRSMTKVYPYVRAVISGKTVYYTTVKWVKGTITSYTLKKCNLSGKNKKTIKKAPKNMELLYVGRKAAYFKNYNTGEIKKLTYSTKKFTTVK